MKESIFNIYKHSGNLIVIFNTLSRALVSMDSHKYAKILAKLDSDETDSNIDELYNKDFFVNDEINEFSKFLFQFKIMSEDLNLLSITYVITMACNFNCCYCFEGDKKVSNDDISMTPSQFSSIYSRLLVFTNPKAIDFNFFGGEPLLEFKHICDVVPNIAEINENNNLVYKINIVSNGYLLDRKIIKTCKEIGINSFQITIDGDKQQHDKYRVLKNGTGTYDVIIENIYLLLEYGIEVVININFCSENYLGIIKFLQDMPEYFKNKVYIKFNELKVTNCNNFVSNRSENNIFTFNKLYNELRSLDISDNNLELKDYGPCMANRKSSIIISRTGEVSKCIYGVGDQNYVFGNLLKETNLIDSFF